ncbi:response regulator [Brevundimonas sp. NIBR11]|uniref:response regulator transcription factor n=1 Tax=Brevundimonas sp. NIBR11 TaxID=3015999 RepID=UPI0022EFFA93|nr:response regulator [Brevundimonas sp. NIBR11]WGM30706.1 Alkaline phosphatase synthesis transcriptional regulatory protein PhoP [Brevundimonas sp. NIBR11]
MDKASADRHILIIEDDRPLLLGMARAFAQAGARVVLAADGAEGLRRFMSGSPDLVVTDIIMPEREGIETILAMKAARPEVPILAVSGGGQTPAGEFLSLAKRLGADAVLAKPFRARQLLDAARLLIDLPPTHAAA